MVTYEKSIDSEMSKLKEIKKRYVCYKCGEDNALEHSSFWVDINFLNNKLNVRIVLHI